MTNDNSGLMTVNFESRADMEEEYSEYLFDMPSGIELLMLDFSDFGNINFSGGALTSDQIAAILSYLVATGEHDGYLIVSGGTNASYATWSVQAKADKTTLGTSGWTVTNNA